MINDTAARKLLALELLSMGLTIRQICDAEHMNMKTHKIRLWKDADMAFRRKWNEIMDQLGRFVERG